MLTRAHTEKINIAAVSALDAIQHSLSRHCNSFELQYPNHVRQTLEFTKLLRIHIVTARLAEGLRIPSQEERLQITGLSFEVCYRAGSVMCTRRFIPEECTLKF